MTSAVMALCVTLLLLLAPPARATNVSGTLASSQTWTKTGSPYTLTGNTTVGGGATLTIQPGVRVEATNAWTLRVTGVVKAVGTPADPITFSLPGNIRIGGPSDPSEFAWVEFHGSNADLMDIGDAPPPATTSWPLLHDDEFYGAGSGVRVIGGASGAATLSRLAFTGFNIPLNFAGGTGGGSVDVSRVLLQSVSSTSIDDAGGGDLTVSSSNIDMPNQSQPCEISIASGCSFKAGFSGMPVATGLWWGTGDPFAVDGLIYDGNDEQGRSIVAKNPIATQPYDLYRPTSAVDLRPGGAVPGATDVSGTAADSSTASTGVARVDVSLADLTTGKWWSGQAWVDDERFLTATGTSAWHLTIPAIDRAHDYRVRTLAVDGAGNSQWAATSQDFSVDKTPPEDFALASPEEGLNTKERKPPLSWTATTDNAGGTGIDHYEVWIDGSQSGADVPISSTSFTPSSPLGDGAHTWWVKAVDRAGNERDTSSRSFIIDNDAPAAASLVTPADGASNLPPRPTFSWTASPDTASGIDHYELRIDGTTDQDVPPSACAGTTCSATAVKALGQGGHYWEIFAVDHVGNGRASQSRSFAVDATPPAAFDLSAPANGGATSNTRPTLSWQATTDSGSGVAGYDVLIDGVTIATGLTTSSHTPSAALAEGVHTWSVIARDVAGNSRGSALQSFRVDTVPPTEFGLSSPGSDDVVNDSTPTLSWLASGDAGAGLAHYEIWIDGNKVGPDVASTVTSATVDSGLADGSHAWEVHAVDGVGNTRASPTRLLVIDTVRPEAFDLVSPAASAADLPPQPTFSWKSAADATGGVAHYELWIDGARAREVSPASCATSCSTAPVGPLANGAHEWEVHAIDSAGNERRSAARAFAVDGAPPTPFDLGSPLNDLPLGTPRPILSWHPSSDAGAGLARYEVWVDGSRIAGDVPTDADSFTPAADLPDGRHTWRVIAVDGVGNGRSTGTGSFVVDTVAPSASVDAAPNPVLAGRTVAFDATHSTDAGSGIADYSWDLDGDGTFETDTGSVPTATHTYDEPGAHTASVRATDRVGLAAVAQVQVRVSTRASSGEQIGITIEDGKQYTRTARVKITALAPAFANEMLVSNDGGFRNAQRMPVAATIDWTLDSRGAERTERIVYVRFLRGSAVSETYTDNITLDDSPPVVVRANAKLDKGGRPRRLRLSARDRGLAGVESVQMTRNRHHPATSFVKYARDLPIGRRFRRAMRGNGPLSVRVRDRAGNPSPWRRVTVNHG
jgi:hypothetical protein